MTNLKNNLKQALVLSVFTVILISNPAGAANLKGCADLTLYSPYCGCGDTIDSSSGFLTVNTDPYEKDSAEKDIALVKFTLTDSTELNAVKSGSTTLTSAVLKLYSNDAITVPELYAVNPSFLWSEASKTDDFSYSDISGYLISTGITGVYNTTDNSLNYNLLSSNLIKSNLSNKSYSSISFALMYGDTGITQSANIFSINSSNTEKAPMISYTTGSAPSPEPTSMLLGIISLAGIAGFKRRKSN